MSVKCPDVLWILLGIFAGLVLPVQTLVNTRLRASTGTPFSSSLISFAVGTMTLLVIATAVTGGEFGISRAFGEPLWIWFCLLYTSPSPRDVEESRMPSSA